MAKEFSVGDVVRLSKARGGCPKGRVVVVVKVVKVQCPVSGLWHGYKVVPRNGKAPFAVNVQDLEA